MAAARAVLAAVLMLAQVPGARAVLQLTAPAQGATVRAARRLSTTINVTRCWLAKREMRARERSRGGKKSVSAPRQERGEEEEERGAAQGAPI